jgi:hypothetical protein
LSALGASKAERKQYKKIHISELLNQIPEIDPTEELLPEDIWNTYLQDPDRAGEKIPEDIKFDVHGTESEKRAIIALLNKYIDVFSSRVGAEPSLITPMKIDVDFAAWERDRRSREPTRPQTAARQAAIEKWLRQAIADKVIRQSEAKAWSQLHLTPKPNGQWRFNVDYRALNKYTRAARTLIPNIADLLRRIGAKGATRFAKMDATSGFHQVAIDEDSRKYTAFAAGNEIYEFCRMSMGLMNAPWHFQQMLQRKVFGNLLHHNMELYIDDILTWGRDFNGLLANLEKVFKKIARA